jgi:signal transduction histidine kinase
MSSWPNELVVDERRDLLLVPDGAAALLGAPAADVGALGQLLARLPIGIVSVGPRLRIDYLNAAAVGQLDAGRVGELLPDPWPVFSLRKFAAHVFTQAAVPPRVVDTADGRLLEVEGVPPADGAANALLLLQDVTARERRARAEREFVANAAHELRTPIAAITSAVGVLQGGAKELPPDRDCFLGHIERESDRLARLAGALLLLARIETGETVPSLRLVEVRPLLEELLQDLEPREGVTVRLRCEGGLWVLADRDLLLQALLNVATNATRHTTAGEIELACRQAGRACELEVRDTGAGIEAAARERVFERFYRPAGSAEGGFGLGLAITRDILHALGGTVELESAVGVGTRVRLRLPAAQVVRR